MQEYTSIYIPFKDNPPYDKYVTGDAAYEAVYRDDDDALLSVSHTANVTHEYCDFSRGTRVTLLGLCIMRRATRCMWVTLMHTNACADDVCLRFGVQFMRSAIPMTMTAREFCPYQQEALDVLTRYDLRCAQLSATQWVLVNIPACWRDLSEDVLKRLRYA